MSEDRITEKVYCYDHPSAYNNHDALAIAAMNHRGDDNNSWWPMMAMMNGGMNNWMNNPFAYMMMFALFRNGFGGWNEGFGWNNGQGQQNIEMQNQLQAIRSQLQDNQNSSLLMDAIKGNGFSLSQLSQNLQIDFNTLQKCCCDVQAQIQQVAGQVGFSAERVINAVNMGDCSVIQALKDCCCTTQKLIQEQGYENRIATVEQTNTLQRGQDFINRSIERGFAASDYATQKQTCDIITAGNANTQRIIDTLNNHWNDESQRKIQDLKFELSQERQNNLILSRLNGCGNSCGCGCGNGCGL